jgi:uncharacterized protein with HEPN domain
MNPDDVVRLRHMIEAGRVLAQMIEGRQRVDLDVDLTLSFAVVRAIEIFGEAASRLSEDTRRAAPNIPWAAIVGMRNRLAHAYFDINKDIVWVAASREIPELLPLLSPLLPGD